MVGQTIPAVPVSAWQLRAVIPGHTAVISAARIHAESGPCSDSYSRWSPDKQPSLMASPPNATPGALDLDQGRGTSKRTSPRPRATRNVPPGGVTQSDAASSQSRNARESQGTLTVRCSPGTTSSAIAYPTSRTGADPSGRQ